MIQYLIPLISKYFHLSHTLLFTLLIVYFDTSKSCFIMMIYYNDNRCDKIENQHHKSTLW